MWASRAGSREPESCRVDDGHDRNKDQGRAGEGHQPGRPGVQAPKIQAHKAASGGQRGPQVFRKRQGGFAGQMGFPTPDEMSSPRRGHHPDGNQARRGQQREQPADQPPPERGHHSDVPDGGTGNRHRATWACFGATLRRRPRRRAGGPHRRSCSRIAQLRRFGSALTKRGCRGDAHQLRHDRDVVEQDQPGGTHLSIFADGPSR